MASSTIYTLNQMLKDYYIEDGITFATLKEWTCPNHQRPQFARYEYICSTGDACEYPADCPHADYVEVEPTPACCIVAEWVYVLDENGDNILEVSQHRGIRGMMDEPILVNLLKTDYT